MAATNHRADLQSQYHPHPQLEAELKATLPGIKHLGPDFTKLDSLSSVGLRILLGAQKQTNRQGNTSVRKHNLITNRSDGLKKGASTMG